jgi:hypothetical protein
VSELDRFVPEYQFRERHSVEVNAPKKRVYEAIKSVTAKEIFLFRTLTWIRRRGRPGPEGILTAPADMPILEVATRTTFLTLVDDPDREAVVGTVVIAPRGRSCSIAAPGDFLAIREAGFAVAAMNFSIEARGSDGCLLTTETRVFATDPASRRRFALYWAIIRPGSGFIRRMWLRAIKRRAEKSLGSNRG